MGLRGPAWLAGALLLAAPAAALQAVLVTVTGPEDEDARADLQERLTNASLAAQALEQPSGEEEDFYGIALSEYGRMIGTLYEAGYYGPEVSVLVDGREAAEIDPFEPPAEIGLIQIRVDTGPQFRFGEVGVAPRAPEATAEPVVDGFAEGEVARADLVGAAANAGLREWREEGHPKADLDSQEVTAFHEEQRLEVDLRLAPGPRLRFGELQITGDRDVSNRRVREIMGWPEGEVYSPDELRDAANRVRRTGVFRTVSVIEAAEPNPDGTLDYTMTLIEELPRRYGFSAELATDEGLTVSGFWLHRNLFGGAERLRIDGEVANIGGAETGLTTDDGTDTSLTARLTRPGTFGPDNDLFFFGSFEDTNDPDFDELAFTLGLGVRRNFSDDLFAEVAGGLRYSDVTDDFGEREFYHAVFPSVLEWDKRDDPGDAKQGFFIRIEEQPFIGLEETSESGLLSEVDARGYLGFGANKGTVLAARLQLGNVFGSSLEGTPPDFLFFSGGGGTVRGQRFQSLGVEDSQGRETGGRSFIGIQSEYRQSLGGALGVVLFYDVGYIAEGSTATEDADVHSGTGIGVRYATPIGPVRVDVGTPVDGDREAFSSAELYIGVGQAF